MKHYAWNPEKNEKLKAERGISFEEIVFHIEHGDEVDVLAHANPSKYPGQKVSVVLVEGYAYLAPICRIRRGDFLKTTIPSRKATKRYVGKSR
jgi:uncharacterized DUF497 family protein